MLFTDGTDFNFSDGGFVMGGQAALVVLVFRPHFRAGVSAVTILEMQELFSNRVSVSLTKII